MTPATVNLVEDVLELYINGHRFLLPLMPLTADRVRAAIAGEPPEKAKEAEA